MVLFLVSIKNFFFFSLDVNLKIMAMAKARGTRFELLGEWQVRSFGLRIQLINIYTYINIWTKGNRYRERRSLAVAESFWSPYIYSVAVTRTVS